MPSPNPPGYAPSTSRGALPSRAAVQRLNDLSEPHRQSFNFLLRTGLSSALLGIPPRSYRAKNGDVLRFWLEGAAIGHPLKGDASAADARLLPSECRERGMTYGGELSVTLARTLNGGEVMHTQHKLGLVPIMVRSDRCHLSGLAPHELVAAREEACEFGGYFICNGIERVIRMLQIPKRNYPMAITRSAYSKRGPLYSDKGIMMRCVRESDQSSVTLVLHYLTDGSATVRFTVRKQEFFLPVIMVLKALLHTTDREIYERVLAGERSNTYLSDRVLMLLRDAKRFGAVLHSRRAALEHIGSRFRAVMDCAEALTDEQAGQALLDDFVLVHLASDAPRDKFNLMVLMLRKLYAFVSGAVTEDNADSLANQELLLGGHLLQVFLKEKLYEFTQGIELQVKRDEDKKTSTQSPLDLSDAGWWRRCVARVPGVGAKAYYLIATGNLRSSSGLDMMQVSGYTVVADKINFIRFTTHFRSVHRGQFFTTMKTTTVRKLLPESWGFLCPVHTPDGGPCGLLNHIAAPASVVALPMSDADYVALGAKATALLNKTASSDLAPQLLSREAAPPASIMAGLTSLCVALGMVPHAAAGLVLPASHMPIMIDGRVAGGAAPHDAFRISRALRTAKALAGAVVAGIDRVGSGETPGQGEAVARLVRAAVQGLSDPDQFSQSGMRPGVAAQTRCLSELGSLGVVPPSLEVAFIPPPWWDTDVDPTLDPDAPSTHARAAACSFLDAPPAEGAPSIPPAPPPRLKGGIVPAPPEKLVGLFPGLFLHTSPQRPVRPVLQLDTGLVELLSPLEQLFLDIACTPEDVTDILQRTPSTTTPLLYTHIELSPTAMLSEVAALTPFSDLNQSPRNMYQCQMGKQTMGTPAHALSHRTDSKLYRLQNVQAPLVQNAAQSALGLDEYPNGANACVAVIAYTGYDMEDACIINKSSFERGWGWAAVYKSVEVDLNANKSASDVGRFIFHNTYLRGEQAAVDAAPRGASLATPHKGDRVYGGLDADGLPPIGAAVREGDALYSILDTVASTHRVVRHKDPEPAFIHEIRMLPPIDGAMGAGAHERPGVQRVSIKLRYDRRPVVGDKFSSRHGQKGVLSYLWPTEDMPFADTGMTPDVIINPHAFPSRMTIGMLVESMAGKAGALHGAFQDSTPFRFDEKNRAVDHFGEQLRAAGFSYYGTEAMTSGITGEPLGVDIFFGVVYYQRLRHMVKDKAQVRSTGPINSLTRQPVKGRKSGGGVRFGEMERDALLAHGAAFLLLDRLCNSSDRHIALVCRRCGSLLSPFSAPHTATTTELAAGGRGALDRPAGVDMHGHGDATTTPLPGSGGVVSSAINLSGAAAPQRGMRVRRAPMCSSCGSGDAVVAVALPYVLRYLACELAGMGVRMKLELSD